MKDLLKLVLNLFFPHKEPVVKENKEPAQTPKRAVSLEDWITSSGKYPERAFSSELTYDVRSSAMLLVDKINQLFRELGINNVSVSSGFRPTKVNANIAGAAKSSGHTRGLAIDFVDADGALKQKVAAHPGLLRKLDLFMEHPDATPTWMHLDYIKRTDRPNRLFKP